MSEADVVLLVLDATAPPHEDDKVMVATLSGRPFLIVINKQDLANGKPRDRKQTLRTIETSALTGSGIPELRCAILSLVTNETPDMESAVLTNQRQQRSVSDAIGALDRAHQAASVNIPHEMILLNLYEGLRALDAFSGSTTSDDILNLIFNNFCIGK
jgi:tRNA modification GTPase